MKRIDTSSFGPNDWLIREMYRQYLEDPDLVSEAWRDFFSDYQPEAPADSQPTPESRSAVSSPAPSIALPEAEGATSVDERDRRSPQAAAAGLSPAPEGEVEPATDSGAIREEPASRMEPKPEEEPAAAAQTDRASSQVLKGADAVVAKRMEESLSVPTATSFRVVPAKLLEVNRSILNRHLARVQGGKVSFTHIIGWAVVKGLVKHPGMNVTFGEVDGKPGVQKHSEINLGLAVDVKRKDGTRTLLVPNIKDAGSLEFSSFFRAYEDLIRKVQGGKLSPDDFAGTTVTITNPGTVGTVQSVPRLMAGQAAIIGVGAIGYPAEYQASDPETLAEMGVGKVLTLTSTYDHRVIQGAESGEFLGDVYRLLLGEESFYDEVFRSIHVPYVPARWHQDHNPPADSTEAAQKHQQVQQLINMYRVRGHLIADLDPLETKPPQLHPELDPVTFGLSIWDLDRNFTTGGLAGKEVLPLGEILGILRDAYCRTASVEYMHISEPDQKRWIQDRVEGVSTDVPIEDKMQVLEKLNEAEAFETFLQQKYVGHKRFSLEGAESLIPMLDALLDRAADEGVEETVIGMSHRGRLNVLVNIIGKSYAQIFREFEGDIDPNTSQGSGDVKYHLGATGKHTSRAGNQMLLTLASNPSHLESVDPVVQGMVRAKQDVLGRGAEVPVLALQIHGDAAFAGQGVVAETLNLSQLQGYRTGGTIHIVVNNQLGFTTGADYGRSSTYATDVAKTVMAPIFHVNGDDPEACVRVTRLAFELAREFLKDVVIDMWCYRRWGHNEADEPSFTQPLMYSRIKNRRSVRKLYTERLVNEGDLSVEDAETVLEEFKRRLQQAFDEVPKSKPPAEPKVRTSVGVLPPVSTGVERSTLDELLAAITTVPEGFHPHPKLAKWLEERAGALDKNAIDWSLGEALAFGSLLLEGASVRLSGQDSRRGTFSQRHSALVDQQTGEEYTPLAHLGPGQGKFFAFDSLLSEFAVLGFEYGYSVANPEALVLWEAQFGDFGNGAQVIIDQFVVAAEDKWGQPSGLVMLLPHGYEGQGPEHSSARLERFLQMAAMDDFQIAVPTTPGQYFHLLRRQIVRDVRKPLVVMTPKSLLRLPAARGGADDFTTGHFREALDDPAASNAKRLIFCTGKIYYEMAKKREEKGLESNVALVRVEQLYPFPADQLREQIERYKGEVYWVQEEPENMGAARFIELNCMRLLSVELTVVSRPESPSPATGSYTLHQLEQEAILEQAFAGL